MTTLTQEIHLQGFAVCRGIAIGKPFFLNVTEDVVPEYVICEEEIDLEVARYQRAVELSLEDIRILQKQLENESLFEGVNVLDAQLQIIQDPLLTSHIENEVRRTLHNAESVFQCFINHYQVKFNALDDPFFRERFKDVQDIASRVMGYLRESARFSLKNVPPFSIIFSKDITPTEAGEANLAGAGAFVTLHGGGTSHAAILAKAKGTPFVSNIDFSDIPWNEDSLVIVDGRAGEVIINPTVETLARYQHLRDQLIFYLMTLNQMNSLSTETFDGYQVRLSANVEAASELEALHHHGGSGVGLFRSEYIFLAREIFPSEEEQFLIYKGMVEKMKGLPIIIRTFDIGGDKCIPSKTAVREINPFLGCRAIRFLLKEKAIFKTQLRAILRASAFGDVSILFPMISTLSELIEAKEIVREVENELEEVGNFTRKRIRIGCMIEVPSAAIISDLIAKECDFLSIGTNDLVQYSLAIDRSSQGVSGLYTPTHPSVIRLIKLIVNEANHHGIPVTVCGEVAADPRFTALLLGLGVHELSVSARNIPTVKNAIRNTSIVAASLLAEKVLTLRTAAEIQELLIEEYKKSVPHDFYYNC